jgi:hypothetical protein
LAFYTSDSSNFANSDNSANPWVQTVNPAPLTISADNQSMTYGGMLPALTATFTGLVNGDTPSTFTVSPNVPPTLATVPASSHAGTYPITVSGAVDANYTITFVNGTLTINPAPLTITADSKTITYGGLLPTLTASYSGLVNGDTPASLTTPPTLSTTATVTSDVIAGGYPITATGAVDPDYTISYESGTLTITRANQTITWAAPANIIVGTPLGGTQLNATVSVVGPAAAGGLTYNLPAGTVLGVGSGQTLTVIAAATLDYNAAIASVPINVLYNFPGFLSPVGTPKVAIGNLVPIWFRLLDASGNILTSPADITSLLVAPVNANGSLGQTFVPALYHRTSLGFEKDHFTGSWITKGLSPGIYEILVSLNDGTVHTTKVQLVGQGGTGRNVLIAGHGAATLDAHLSHDDNILIGGWTDWDMNLAALQAIMAEWDRTDLNFADRRSDLLNGTNGQSKVPLNMVNGQLILLTPATNPASSNRTVHSNGVMDTLIGTNAINPATGRRAHNWFFDDALDVLVNFLSSSDKKNKMT